jgi:ubiquinol-cytochrome c reductase cytochrome c1 subunit
VLGGLTAGAATATSATVFAGGADQIHPMHMHWPHAGLMEAYDTAAIRRGYEVYRQVCSTCHSLELINFRNLVGVSHTETQGKALAASFEIQDGPNDEGEMFDRPGKLSDPLPAPYASAEAGRAANNGALPPDLSCIAKARHGGPDYIFSLLTGYDRPRPAGLPEKPGLHYNAYYDGGAIAMAAPLSDGQVEYEDKTEATVSQMARDVSTFLQWCSEPEQDDRKKKGFQYGVTVAFMVAMLGYQKRFHWASLKSRRISWID